MSGIIYVLILHANMHVYKMPVDFLFKLNHNSCKFGTVFKQTPPTSDRWQCRKCLQSKQGVTKINNKHARLSEFAHQTT